MAGAVDDSTKNIVVVIIIIIIIIVVFSLHHMQAICKCGSSHYRTALDPKSVWICTANET